MGTTATDSLHEPSPQVAGASSGTPGNGVTGVPKDAFVDDITASR